MEDSKHLQIKIYKQVLYVKKSETTDESCVSPRRGVSRGSKAQGAVLRIIKENGCIAAIEMGVTSPLANPLKQDFLRA